MEKVLHVFRNYSLNVCVSSASPRLQLLDETKTQSVKDMIQQKNP